MVDVRRSASGAVRILRDAWLIVGITLALLVALEVAYRPESAARLALRRLRAAPASEPPDPWSATAWAVDYMHDDSLEGKFRWKPYVYLRNPTFTGRVMSVDAEGRRVTVQQSRSARPFEVWVFGGSTAFGWFQRDSFTIASEIARQLAPRNVKVTNFGVPGFVFTQELLELQGELRAGRHPDVVLFYDGVNDMWTALLDGVAGLTENEVNRAADFAAGRARAADSAATLRADARVTAHSIMQVARRLLFVRRLRGLPPQFPPRISSDSAARSVAHTYAATVRIAEAMAKEFGFSVVYAWQPSLLSTHKPMTKRERWLVESFKDTVFGQEFRAGMGLVRAPLSAQMKPLVRDRFLDLSDLFRSARGEVYVDVYGHTYESANTVIAAAMIPAIVRALPDSGASRTVASETHVRADARLDAIRIP